MSTKYKITLNIETVMKPRSQEVFLESDVKPSHSEVHEAVLQDTVRFNSTGARVTRVLVFQ